MGEPLGAGATARPLTDGADDADDADDDDFLGAPILTGTSMRASAARGAGDGDLLGLSSKPSPTGLATGRLRVFRLIYALARANRPFLGEPMGAGTTIPLNDGADDLRDDAEDLRDDAAEDDDLRDDAGDAGLEATGEDDLLGLSSKRSPTTLPTGSL